MKIVVFKLLLAALMLLFLLKVAACATGGTSTAGEPGSLTPSEQSDPEFWKMWEEQRGLGG